MRCPFCKENEDRVIDSRESTDAFIVRRRRECLRCNRRFTTRERIDETPLRVVKRDQSREDFERRKILSGMITACQKRPVSMQSLEEITQRIEDKVMEAPDREVTTRAIGRMVMRELEKLDKVAYVRFASVYKSFESAEDFADIAGEVRGSSPKAGNKPVKGRRVGGARPRRQRPAAGAPAAPGAAEDPTP
jgi:transcriptional repressor NrdR